jgi:pyruvate kinase
MFPADFKRTKILATIGPASSSADHIERIITAGANGLRVNFSHGTHSEHAEVIEHARRISRRLGKPVAIVQDLQGPKIRVGQLPSDGINLAAGSVVSLRYDSDYAATSIIPIQYDFSGHVSKGHHIYLRDGQMQLTVISSRSGLIKATVAVGGQLFSHQGINLPDADFAGSILTDKDLADIAWGIKHDIDYMALSFVQTASDIDRLRRLLVKGRSDAAIIAKIETRAAITNLEEIITATDGVMIARGDLAVESKPEAIPIIQRRIIELCKRHHKFVIVATQMLESMVQAPQPTRAEVSDVAVAVLDGADVVMLSAETAVGKYPVETVEIMKRIIRYTQAHSPHELRVNFNDQTTRQSALSAAAIILARTMGAKMIISETSSGATARNLASFRPHIPIAIITQNKRVYQQLALLWGGKVYLTEQAAKGTDLTMKRLKASGELQPGDTVVVTCGRPGVSGGTDTVSIRTVK